MVKPKIFHWEPDEIKSYLVAAAVFAVILSFTDWGTDVVDIAIGLWNLLSAFVIVTISLFVHDFAHRWWAHKRGYKITYKISWFALLLSLLVCFVTNGDFQVFLAGGLVLAIIPKRRLGKFTFRHSLRDEHFICLLGPLASVLLAGLAKGLSLLLPFNPLVVNYFIRFNVLYAVYSMLPFPPLDGFRVAWFSRLLYIFWFGAVFAFMFLALAGIISVILPLIIGFLTFIAFYYAVEK